MKRIALLAIIAVAAFFAAQATSARADVLQSTLVTVTCNDSGAVAIINTTQQDPDAYGQSACGDGNYTIAPYNNSANPVVYVTCNDSGAVTEVDSSQLPLDASGAPDINSYAGMLCGDGNFTVTPYDPSLGIPPPDQGSGGQGGPYGDGTTISGGTDLGTLSADPNVDPDPTLYDTQVLCPDGSIWNIAKGDNFTCPVSP